MNILLTQRKHENNEEANNPIALLDLAPYIRTLGHEVECFYLDELPNKRYDIVGLSILNYEKQVIRNALYLKNKFKDSKIVIGGKGTRSFKNKDNQFLKGKSIEVWSKSGEEYFSGTEDIDFNNYPPWDLRDLKTLRIEKGGIMSTRGCPYNCHFCHNTEKKISFFTAKRTVDNIELIFKVGRKHVFFVDDIFTISIQHILDIYKECKKRGILIEGKNRFFTHINHINKKSVKVMSLFKPIEVQIGLESGDDNMLKIMGKTFTTEIAYKKLKLLSRYVPIDGLFLIGFPGETVESLNNTVKFVTKIRSFLTNIWVSFYVPVENTVGYYLAKKNGIILNAKQNNKEVNYIDKSLTKEDLIKYKNLILSACNTPFSRFKSKMAGMIKKILSNIKIQY